MFVGNFELFNVNFTKKGDGHWVFMNGEILNNSNRNYSSAVFHLSVFDRMHLLWTGAVKVRNFRKRQTRPIEVLMEKLSYESIPRISRYEIFFESGY
jgi:hypothetical protein